ncbi:hypothetical protein, partial [Mycolicibacterium fortuitum]|uniref:hypothetical protein n=1 Tax=Mycolicibacterium fortuitum TaxID=1766 RepID=UPI001C6408CC
APPPPPKNNRALKWVLGATALVAVIAITAVVAISLSGRDNDKGSGPTTSAGSGSSSEFASANDTGPVTIITEDPSCAAWIPILNTLADTEKNGWADRDPAIPASAWNPSQRAQYEAVGQAMRNAADQTVSLAKITTHRVMRELYEQFIAYARAYADAIPSYTPTNDELARTASSATAVLADVCQAIKLGSAPARAPMVQEGPAPTNVAPIDSPTNPERFLRNRLPACDDWKAAVDMYTENTTAWAHTDPNIPAGQWSPEQKALNDAVIPVMRNAADQLEQIGRDSQNSTFEDFAALAAQYRRAYAQAIPTYSTADHRLYSASLKASGTIIAACAAAGA